MQVSSYYSIPALQCGASITEALLATNYGRQVAVCYNAKAAPTDKMLTDSQIQQIAIEPQVRAYIVSNSVSFITPLTFEESLLFTEDLQVSLYLQGETLEDVLKITNVVAYRCLLAGMDIDSAAQCYIWFQLAAFNCCFNEDEALYVTNYYLLQDYSCAGQLAPCTSFVN